MMIGQDFFLKCTFIAILVCSMGCQAEMSDSKNDMNGKIYFGSFDGYAIPLHLVDKITPAEALARDAYYLATYEQGVLVSVEKFFQGEMLFRHQYFYHENGRLKENRMFNEEGKETITFFDERGKTIKRD